MRPHGTHELRGGQTIGDGHGEGVDHVGGALAHELSAQHAAVLRIHNHLDESALAICNEGAAIRTHEGLAHFGLDAPLLAVRLSEPHAGDLRRHVYARGNRVKA